MRRPARHAPWLAYACLGASMAIVGSYVGLSKILVATFPVFLLAWLRFGISGVAMAGWLHVPPGAAPLTPRERRLLFLESFFGNFLFSICMLFGVALSSALAAGVIMAALPAVVAVLSRVFLGERIAGRVAAGIGCAVAGIGLVALGRAGEAGATAGPGTALGHLLLFGAVCCEATYVVVGKVLTGNIGAKRISALINVWGFALVTPLGLWQALGFDFGAVGVGSWALLVGYSIAASVLTVWLWMTGLRDVDASAAGAFTVLLPVSAAAVGVIFLGERFGPTLAVAFALALLGIVLATWPSGAPARAR
jgi:drug/metabolite transporter (DMT)-like permease